MIINKSSYERGFGHGSIYKSEVHKHWLTKNQKGQTRIAFAIKLVIDGLRPTKPSLVNIKQTKT